MLNRVTPPHQENCSRDCSPHQCRAKPANCRHNTAPRLFKEFEIETGKSTWLLGLAGITEGAIPMAIEDPLRVIGSFVLGSMVTGAIVGAMNIGLSTPGAGIFSLFLLHDNGAGGVMAAIGWFGAPSGSPLR